MKGGLISQGEKNDTDSASSLPRKKGRRKDQQKERPTALRKRRHEGTGRRGRSQVTEKEESSSIELYQARNRKGGRRTLLTRGKGSV